MSDEDDMDPRSRSSGITAHALVVIDMGGTYQAYGVQEQDPRDPQDPTMSYIGDVIPENGELRLVHCSGGPVILGERTLGMIAQDFANQRAAIRKFERKEKKKKRRSK